MDIQRLYDWRYEEEQWLLEELPFQTVVVDTPVIPTFPTFPVDTIDADPSYLPLRPPTPDMLGDNLSLNGSDSEEEAEVRGDLPSLSRLQDDAARYAYDAENANWWPSWGTGLTMEDDEWTDGESGVEEDDMKENGSS